jgi:nitroimidazol reductase NimA-like FMN-containing flavoprotein (pyridoxamine 5'-phosphate oxidase superfamily)
VNTSSLQPVAGAAAIKLTMAETLERLRSEAVGRVCIDVNGYPIALPINYVVDETLDGPRIAVRTTPDTEIGSYQGLASLEVDSFDIAAGRAWSVIVRGDLRPLVGRRPNEDTHPFVSDHRTRWMELTIVALSGRRFVADVSHFVVEWQLEPTSTARRAAGR